MNLDTTDHDTTDHGATRWTRRLLPALPLIVALVGLVVLFTRGTDSTSDDRPPTVDLDAVSTERLETILDTSRDDPAFADEIPGVLLVIAERYFTDGEYDQAFSRYAEVLEHPRARRPQFAVALSRVAWIGWLSTGDTATALASVDEALAIAPDNSETYYIKGQILWCGAGDTEAAVELFNTVLRAPDLPAAVRTQVSDDLEAVEAGLPCR